MASHAGQLELNCQSHLSSLANTHHNSSAFLSGVFELTATGGLSTLTETIVTAESFALNLTLNQPQVQSSVNINVSTLNLNSILGELSDTVMFSPTIFGVNSSISNIEIRPVTYYIAFYVGDTAWIKDKAKNGKLEQVYIKEIIVPETSNRISILYKDTHNSLWNANELISHEESQQLAEAYLNARIAAITG